MDFMLLKHFYGFQSIISLQYPIAFLTEIDFNGIYNCMVIVTNQNVHILVSPLLIML